MSVPVKTLRKAPQHVKYDYTRRLGTMREKRQGFPAGYPNVTSRVFSHVTGGAHRPARDRVRQRPACSAAQVAGPTMPSAVRPRLV